MEELNAPDLMEESFEDSFPESVIEDVDGLLWLGYLEDTVDFCGHEFVIRTLRLEEEILAGLITKDYVETLAQAKAWVAAQIGLSIVSIDGDENFCPPAGPNKRDYARARFNYVTSNWYEPTINYLYSRYTALLEKQLMAIEEMENLSQGSRITFTASPDSSIDKADSIAPEIMDLLEDDQED
jgi:hypothetical protein